MRKLALATAAALAVGAVVVPVAAAAAAPTQCSSGNPAGVATTCTGVGPGTFVSVDGGGGCTLGFVLNASDGGTYAETAGHCAVALGSGVHVWRGDRGPAVRLSSAASSVTGGTPGSVIGRVVYAVQAKDDIDDVDFAVIRFSKGVRPYVAVPYYGGPTGLNVDRGDAPQVLNLFGRPPLLGETAPARRLLARSLTNADHVFANGPTAPGDSGAPVLDSDGRAVGVLLGVGGNQVTVSTTAPPADSHEGGAVRILRLAPALKAAAAALHIRLVLALAPATT